MAIRKKAIRNKAMRNKDEQPDNSFDPARVKALGAVVGIAAFAVTAILPAPEGLSPAGWITLGMALLMAAWWSTEVLPIPATALLPVVILPLFEVQPIKAVTGSYGHPIVFLFMGGFLLGIAMQRCNLHQRIALLILGWAGTQPRFQIAGFMLATAFLSMWVSNTATSIMMLPIALSVLSYYSGDDLAHRHYRVVLLLGVAYAASIGGMATLIGTPPNALLAAYLKDHAGIEIGFAQWMLVGLPVSAVMLLARWWWLCRGPLPVATAQVDAGLGDAIEGQGPMSSAEKRVLVVFALTALAWIVRPLLEELVPGLSDTGIAIAAGVVLFMLPSGDGSTRLLDWPAAAALPWGVLLLFGGGLALAGAIALSGLAEWIAGGLSSVSGASILLVTLLIVTVIIFLTEISSNTATTAAFLPLLGALAMAQDISPLLCAAPAALAASCAFMMPVATPPNAVIYASGHVQIGDMIKHGLVINLIAIALVTLAARLLLPVVF